MSQNFCEIYFSPADVKLTPAKSRKKLESYLHRKKHNITEIYSGKAKTKDRSHLIQIGSNEIANILEEVLLFIEKLPCENKPIAKLYFDQSGETLYYCLLDDQLTEFSTLSAIHEYLVKHPQQSPEEEFFTENAKDSNLLLARLKVPAKRFKQQLEALCRSYIAQPDEENYQAIRTFFNKNSEDYIDYPHLGKKPGCYSDEAIARSLMFFQVDGNYVYMGFNADCLIDSAYTFGSWGGESPALNMISAISCCKSVKDARGKLWSNEADPEKEWYIYVPASLDYMYFVENKSPMRLWRG